MREELSLAQVWVMRAKAKRLQTLLWAVIFVVPAGAQNANQPEHQDALLGLPSRQHLFGDWGGEQTALAEKGINTTSAWARMELCRTRPYWVFEQK